MTYRFAVVYEAEADFRTATELADRVLLEVADWLDAEHLDDTRVWLPADTQGRALTWTGLKKAATEAGIRPHGHFGGEPGLPDAAAARRAIDYVLKEYRNIDAIILVRDQDHQPNRWDGLEQARGEHHGKTEIVVGLAIVMREAWVMSGFDPVGHEETARLDAERQTLGLDPRQRSHELTAKDEQAIRSPKRVLRSLSGADRDRERKCWAITSLKVLRERGDKNGLAAYLHEIRDRLARLIGHVGEG